MNEKTIDQIEMRNLRRGSGGGWHKDEIAGVWTFICTGIQCGQVFALKQ